MYLVEDIRLASPTQLAAIRRHRAFFSSPLSKNYTPPKITPPCEVISTVPVNFGNSVNTRENPKKEETSVEDARECVIPYVNRGFASHVVNVIVYICGTHYGVSRAEIMGFSRLPRIIRARHAAYWVAKNANKTWSYPEVGRRLGNKDHTTIMHGIKKVDRLRAENPKYAAELDGLLTEARARLNGCIASSVPGECQRDVLEQSREGQGADSVT